MSVTAILSNFLRIFNETYVSTQSAASPPHPWFSRSYEHEERTYRPQAPACEGQEAAVGFFIAVKLRRRAEFIRVYDHGTRYRGRLMTCFALPNEVGSPRLGIAASQKIGNAVIRNRAKGSFKNCLEAINH
jgi:hypothetical protein